MLDYSQFNSESPVRETGFDHAAAAELSQVALHPEDMAADAALFMGSARGWSYAGVAWPPDGSR